MKKCCTCRAIRPLEDFSRKKTNADGLQGQCRSCNAAYLRGWAERNRERKRQMDRDYAARNREHARAKTKAWVTANPDRKRQGDKAYAEKNRERLSAQNAKYRAKNRERILAQKKKYAEENRTELLRRQKAWKAANRGKVLANITLRKMRKRKATPAWLTKEQRLQMRYAYELAQIYSDTLGQPYHVDHIIPVCSPVVCGLHVPWNLQVIPAVENVLKSNRLPDL